MQYWLVKWGKEQYLGFFGANAGLCHLHRANKPGFALLGSALQDLFGPRWGRQSSFWYEVVKEHCHRASKLGDVLRRVILLNLFLY